MPADCVVRLQPSGSQILNMGTATFSVFLHIRVEKFNLFKTFP